MDEEAVDEEKEWVDDELMSPMPLLTILGYGGDTEGGEGADGFKLELDCVSTTGSLRMLSGTP